VTNNSLAANQRPNISLIDRRHSSARRVPSRVQILTTLPRRQNTARPIDRCKPYQRRPSAAAKRWAQARLEAVRCMGWLGGDVLTRSCQTRGVFLGVARLNHALGGAVAVNDGRAVIWANQSHSFGCPGRQRRSGFRASSPRAHPSVICTILSAPCSSELSISASQRSAIRRLRCASCWRTVGER